MVQLRHAGSTDIQRLTDFLTDNSMTTVGLQKCIENFIIAVDDKGSWVGVAGYEMYGRSALLRSVAVEKGSRNLGHGRALVEAVLAETRKQGVRTVYLFTESAEQYFKRLGFDPAERDQIDPAVKSSPQFTECCNTHRLMRRPL